MKSQGHLRLVPGTVVPLVLFAGLLTFSLGGRVFSSAGAQTQPTSITGNGLHTVTFDTPSARVTVKLPDEIRTGDTISGTLVQEPKGATEDERAKNKAAVKSRVVRLLLTRARKPDEPPRGTGQESKPVVVTVPLSGGDTPTVQTTSEKGNVSQIEFKAVAPASDDNKSSEAELGSAVIPLDADPAPESARTADPTPTPKFSIPPLGQTGRPVVVTGPFDGKGSNTDAKAAARPKPFIKTSTRQTDIDLLVIAESPRKAVLEFPEDFTGRTRITITDWRTQTSSPFRNVDVRMRAVKTSLVKGEKTTLTVEVSGLEGITMPVPLTLRNTGVVTMSGGPYQQLSIQPSEISRDGRYTTTREITGVQAGAWGATATVITHRFNICMQDDSAPARRIIWNTFTGDYIFTNPFAPSGGTTLTGQGKPEMKGCIITLTHNAPDRRVMARLDACSNDADASVQAGAQKTSVTITDRNVSDNFCPSR